MSTDNKMREALESLVKLHRKHFGLDGAWDAEIIKAEYLLAQQPAAVVELTDEELMDIARPTCGNFRWPSTTLDIMRQAIAAHIAKQRGV